jgi:hypothetical protein
VTGRTCPHLTRPGSRISLATKASRSGENMILWGHAVTRQRVRPVCCVSLAAVCLGAAGRPTEAL